MPDDAAGVVEVREEWLSVAAAARLLECGADKVRRLVRDGHLRVRQLQGSFMQVRRSDVVAVIEAATRPAPPRPSVAQRRRAAERDDRRAAAVLG
jgi:excisionase family DNA binding protein